MRYTIVTPASIPRCAGATSGIILNVGRDFVGVTKANAAKNKDEGNIYFYFSTGFAF